MSWEYDPKEWFRKNIPDIGPRDDVEPEDMAITYEEIHDEIEQLCEQLLEFVNDENDLLSDATLFGYPVDTYDPAQLRIMLAFMIMYKRMK